MCGDDNRYRPEIIDYLAIFRDSFTFEFSNKYYINRTKRHKKRGGYYTSSFNFIR
jgi:hypothetical protein